MQTLLTSLLTTGELTTACVRLTPILTPLLAGQPLLLTISAAATTHSEAITLAATRKAASDFTDPLKENDNARDVAFTALRDFASNWTKNPLATPAQSAAAVRLQAIFAHHGNTLLRVGYTRQTAMMNALIADLRSTTATADLAAISLTPLFNAMTAAQTTFEATMADKAAAEGGLELPTIAAHRPQLEQYLKLLLENISVWQEIASTPELEEAIGKIDEVITQITTPALARRTRKESEQAEESTPPDVPPTA
jgi:light-regulated signal transduction histidine kinase (bacteriophytochrome)